MLIQFADTLEDHEEGILAYYDYRISTGLTRPRTSSSSERPAG